MMMNREVPACLGVCRHRRTVSLAYVYGCEGGPPFESPVRSDQLLVESIANQFRGGPHAELDE